MNWEKINFGTNKKVIGKTLPQIMFIDPDWFYTQYEYKDSFLRKKFVDQAEMIYKRSRNIKPLNGHYIKYFLFYDGSSDGFVPITINEAEEKYKECIEKSVFLENIDMLDSQKFTIRKRIDLKYPKELKNYDKKSYKIFITQVKEYLNMNKRITEKQAIDFFENNNNFIL